MPIIKPEINKPVVGTISFADQADGQYGLQLKLSGEWDGIGKGTIYLNHDVCLGSLRALGVLGEAKEGKFGPAYNVVRGKRVVITKDINKHTNIALESGNPAPGTRLPQPTANGSQATHAPSESPAVTFKRKVITFKRCVEESLAIYKDAFQTVPLENIVEVVQSGAACLFIEATKAGLLAPLPPGPIKSDQLVALESLQLKLAMPTEDFMANVEGLTGGIRDPLKLTDVQAKRLIESLEKKYESIVAKRRLEEENMRLMQERGTAPPVYDNQEADIPW